MKLYTSEGWFNYPEVKAAGYPFNLIVGGRGTGKTYGGLKEEFLSGRLFLYLRRTQTILDQVNIPELAPYGKVARDLHLDLAIKSRGKNAYAWMLEDRTVTLSAALSTFSHLRGINLEEVEIILYDEFIPEPQEKPIRKEATALWNTYETVNRNRELEGRKPVQLFCFSNADDLESEILRDLNLMGRAERMQRKGTELWTDDKRGIQLIVLAKSPISEAKRGTALYKLKEGSDFSDMALDNKFQTHLSGQIGTLPLKELVPVVTVGTLTVYKHKSDLRLYASTHRAGSPPEYKLDRTDLPRFRRSYGWIWEAYLNRRVLFEERVCEILLIQALTGKY